MNLRARKCFDKVFWRLIPNVITRIWCPLSPLKMLETSRDDFIAINNIELGRRGRPDNDLKYIAKVVRLVDSLYILKNKLKQKVCPWK